MRGDAAAASSHSNTLVIKGVLRGRFCRSRKNASTKSHGVLMALLRVHSWIKCVFSVASFGFIIISIGPAQFYDDAVNAFAIQSIGKRAKRIISFISVRMTSIFVKFAFHRHHKQILFTNCGIVEYTNWIVNPSSSIVNTSVLLLHHWYTTS